MRIAHFIQGRCNPDSANGVDKTVYFLSSAQAALGHSVAIFCISDEPALPVPRVEMRAYPPSRGAFAVPRELELDLNSWQPSVVHLHAAYTPRNITLARSLRREHIPYVVTAHGNLSATLLRRRAYLKLPYKYALERPHLNRAAFVHAVADEADIRKFGVTVPVVCAPNGFNAASIPNELSCDTLHRRFAQVAGRRVALFVGRLDVLQKGLDILLDAFAMAVRTHPELMLVVVGPDMENGRAYLESSADRLGIANSVIFWGPAFGREKFELLASSDFFVHASRWEAGLPFAVIEALGVGKPCVVTRPADPLALVAQYGAGRVVEPTVAALAEALGEVARLEREELDDLGRAARRLVDEELKWERTAQTLVSAYAQYCHAS